MSVASGNRAMGVSRASGWTGSRSPLVSMVLSLRIENTPAGATNRRQVLPKRSR